MNDVIRSITEVVNCHLNELPKHLHGSQIYGLGNVLWTFSLQTKFLNKKNKATTYLLPIS